MKNPTSSSSQNQSVGVNQDGRGSSSASGKASSRSASKAKAASCRTATMKTPQGLSMLVKAIGTDGTCLNKLNPGEVEGFQVSMESLTAGMKVQNWKTLEVGKEFKKNDKIRTITDETLVVGLDVAKNKYDLRAYDKSGIEFTIHGSWRYDMTRDGFCKSLNALKELAVLHKKKQIIIGIEPTGHYWFNLYTFFNSNGVSVFMVNPNAVNKSKEIDDNLQSKSDQKDPSVIAKLVRDGAYSVPYRPEGHFAEARQYAHFVEKAIQERAKFKNQGHRWLDVFFPELEGVYEAGIFESTGGMLVLEKGLLPADIRAMGEAGILDIFVKAKLRGPREKKAKEIFEAAQGSIGSTDTEGSTRSEMKDIIADLRTQDKRAAEYEDQLIEEVKAAYPHFDKVTAIRGVSERALALLLADVGDISRFHKVDELNKLCGIVPVLKESGKYKGLQKISKRGRKRMRYHLYEIAEKVYMHDDGFKALYLYYTTRQNNPYKHKQAMMAISSKFLTVMYHILTTGENYDSSKVTPKTDKKDEPKQKDSENA